MGRRFRAHDWLSSPLGPPQTWPQPLRVLTGVILGSRQAMFVAWGPKRIMLYNDAYAELCQDRHPAAFGRPFGEAWSDIMGDAGPLLDRAFAGEPVHMDDIRFFIKRGGRVQETHFSFSYTPVRDEDGSAAGVFCVCDEITTRVLADRLMREQVLRDSEGQLQLVIDAVPALVSFVDADCVYRIVNASYERWFGIGAKDVIGRSMPEVLGADAYAMLRPKLERALGGERVSFEAFVPYSRGPHRHVHVDYVPRRAASGAIEGLCVLVRDIGDQKNNEAALRDSEERFRSLVETTTAVVWSTDAKGSIVSDNPSWSAFTGQTRDQYSGWGWLEAVHPDDRAGLARAWRESLRSHELYDCEYRLRRADGEYRWTAARGAPIFDGAGGVREWIGANTDITDRREAEESLRESESRFRAMADAAPAMLWMTDPGASCVFLSKGWFDYTGQEERTALGLGWLDAVHPLDRASATEQLLEANARRKPFALEHRVRRRDGAYRWVIDAGQPRFSAKGVFEGYIGSVIDIDARRRTETALRDTEQRFRQIAENVDAVFYITEMPERRISYVSPAYQRLWGLDPKDILDARSAWTRRIHPEDAPGVAAAFEDFAGGGAPFDAEYRVRLDGGRERWVRDRGAVAMRDESGGVRRITGIAEDITNEKEAQAQQRLLTNELNHRVKNTLAVIQAIAAQTARFTPDPKAFKEVFGERVIALARVHDVLTATSWSGATLSEVAATLAPFRSGGGQGVRAGGPPVRLEANAAVILSLGLHELATNATKYGALSKAGGYVTLEWTVAGEPPALEIEWREHGGPRVSPPKRQGFGRRVIESMAGQLDGEIVLDYPPEGVRCRIRMPLE